MEGEEKTPKGEQGSRFFGEKPNSPFFPAPSHPMLGVRSKLLQVSKQEGIQFCPYPINSCIMPQCWAGEAQVEMKVGGIYVSKIAEVCLNPGHPFSAPSTSASAVFQDPAPPHTHPPRQGHFSNPLPLHWQAHSITSYGLRGPPYADHHQFKEDVSTAVFFPCSPRSHTLFFSALMELPLRSPSVRSTSLMRIPSKSVSVRGARGWGWE